MSASIGGDGYTDRACPLCGVDVGSVPDHLRYGHCPRVDPLRERLDERDVGGAPVTHHVSRPTP